jgi:hypothetical protein
MVVRSHEGREPVAPARVERTGARGRGQQAAHSGGVGAPPGGQYEPPARSWLTVRPLRRARGFSGEAVRNDGKPGEAQRRPREDGRPESAARCRKKTPDGAPEGATPPQGGVQNEGPSRHPARRPLSSAEGRPFSKPRAHSRRENDGALLK